MKMIGTSIPLKQPIDTSLIRYRCVYVVCKSSQGTQEFLLKTKTDMCQITLSNFADAHFGKANDVVTDGFFFVFFFFFSPEQTGRFHGSPAQKQLLQQQCVF